MPSRAAPDSTAFVESVEGMRMLRKVGTFDHVTPNSAIGDAIYADRQMRNVISFGLRHNALFRGRAPAVVSYRSPLYYVSSSSWPVECASNMTSTPYRTSSPAHRIRWARALQRRSEGEAPPRPVVGNSEATCIPQSLCTREAQVPPSADGLEAYTAHPEVSAQPSSM